MSDIENKDLKNSDILELLERAGMPEFYRLVLKMTCKKANDSIPKEHRLSDDQSMLIIGVNHIQAGEVREVPSCSITCGENVLVEVMAYPTGKVWENAGDLVWHMGPDDSEPSSPMRANYTKWRESVTGHVQPAAIPLTEQMQRDFLRATLGNASEYAIHWEANGNLTAYARGVPLCDEQDVVVILRHEMIDDTIERRHVDEAVH